MQIAVIGAGGHGREVFQTAERVTGADPRSARVSVAGFYDDRAEAPAVDLLGATILGRVHECALPSLIGIGSGAVRERLDASILTAGPAVDPTAFVGADIELKPGVVIFAQACVTTNVSVGRHVHVGRSASVGHDSVLGDYVSVMPLVALSGDVRVGERTFLGTGAAIRQGVTIGADVTVGMGAVVLDDVPSGATVVGNPARAR